MCSKLCPYSKQHSHETTIISNVFERALHEFFIWIFVKNVDTNFLIWFKAQNQAENGVEKVTQLLS